MLPSHLGMANYANYLSNESKRQSNDQGDGLAETHRMKNNHIDWSIVKEIKQISGLPVIAKGIMCAEDVRLAFIAGIDGIYLSNHGARQLDTTPATIEVLPEIKREVDMIKAETGKCLPIWFDGGVRNGGDVLKALALGADLVWIGRPVLWGLSCEG